MIYPTFRALKGPAKSKGRYAASKTQPAGIKDARR